MRTREEQIRIGQCALKHVQRRVAGVHNTNHLTHKNRSKRDKKPEQVQEKAKIYKFLMRNLDPSSRCMHYCIVWARPSPPPFQPAGHNHVALGRWALERESMSPNSHSRCSRDYDSLLCNSSKRRTNAKLFSSKQFETKLCKLRAKHTKKKNQTRTLATQP